MLDPIVNFFTRVFQWIGKGIGWLVGIGWFGPSTLWMWGLTAPGYPLGVVFGWGPMVAATSAVVPGDRRRLLVLPAALVAYEWLHSHGPFGGVPLSMLGMTQVNLPTLMVARLGGVFLLGAVVSALGVALYLVVVERRWKEPAAIVMAVVLLSVAGAVEAMILGLARGDLQGADAADLGEAGFVMDAAGV